MAQATTQVISMYSKSYLLIREVSHHTMLTFNPFNACSTGYICEGIYFKDNSDDFGSQEHVNDCITYKA